MRHEHRDVSKLGQLDVDDPYVELPTGPMTVAFKIHVAIDT